ncbi:MAG: M43 family zinc metalloprotease [Owenweeksia sp.]|nr:M43 family zinc metalloprotease [Owenweeksia sp.]
MINRVQSGLSINASNNVKDLVQWDSDRYMNVWVVNGINSSQSVGTILGYAYRPRFNQFYRPRWHRDPAQSYPGTIGSGQGVSTGRTFTHEVGHYLGLLHPFPVAAMGVIILQYASGCLQ